MKYAGSVMLLGIICLSSCYYDKHELLNQGSVCDTAMVTYSATVRPILATNCTGCHSGAGSPRGISLDNHAGVKANTTRIMGAITHSPGFTPMPQGGNKLSQCNIEKIRKWINLGALNN